MVKAGRTGMFAIYEFTKEGYKFIEMRKFADGRDTEIEETKEMGEVHDNRVQRKVISFRTARSCI